MDTAVIVSTYNQPKALRRCLLGLLAQTERNFHTIVADDGSTAETTALVRSSRFAPLRIEHFWQLDRQWRRPKILNLVFASIPHAYCIFIDGDCIPRADFVERHLENRRRGYWVSGTRVHIPETVHASFTEDDILSNRIFDVNHLTSLEPALRKKHWRLHPGRWEGILNTLTYRWRCFHGSNSAAWREDILKVNGFDETFGYGSDDREFGMRLANAGVRSRFLKFSLCQIHQDHPSNPNPEQVRRNRRRFRKLFFTRQSWAELGVDTVVARDETERRAAALPQVGRRAA